MSLTGEEIWAALADNGRAPHGPVRIARGEYLVDAAEAAGDPAVRAQALIDVIEAYEFGAEQPKMLVPFAKLLRLWDEAPHAFDRRRTHSLFWYFKWTTGGMIGVPEVPLASISRWLEEMKSRYRQAGYSPRAVHMGRHRLAREAGDMETARAEFQAWLDAPRDQMADCHACELGDQGWWMTQLGRDEEAAALWRPVLEGESSCAEEPHRVLAHSLMPLVRLGRLDEARANHLRGYRLARGVPNLRAALGRHLEFCALTGNEARGLEILAEHAAYLTEGAEDAETRLEFLTGAAILLGRLTALGLGGLDLAATNVADSAADTLDRIKALCDRFDRRNGSSAVSDRVARRLAQRPLGVPLPIGSATLLPTPAATAAPSPAGGRETSAAVDRPADASALDDLIAEADRLTKARHPHARWAWERVAASRSDLPDAAAVQVERVRANALMERDPSAARSRFLDLAARLGRSGQTADALEVRASAATAAFLAGDHLTAETEALTLSAEAETAYAAGELTARQYLGAQGLSVYFAYNAFGAKVDGARRGEQEPDGGEAPAETPDPTQVIAVIEAELELADRLGDPGRAGVYCRMLTQMAYVRGEHEEARARIEGARDRFLAAGQPWDAAEPEAILAQMALAADDAQAAEEYARAALEHAVPQPRDAQAAPDTTRPGAASMLVEAISRQSGRHADLVGAALHAARLWDGVSEPDALNSRFIAARAYLAMKRYAEAAALFDELMPHVEVPYRGAGVAMTREQYGNCLTQLGEHRAAAAQFLAAAALLQDDPDNRVPYARLAWTAAESLQNAGRPDEALAAYRRTADLWKELDAPAARARCLRSAAWLLTWSGDGREPQWAEALGTMRAVLAELEAIPAEGRDPRIGAEIKNTLDQLEQMHSYAEAAKPADDADAEGAEPAADADEA
jgi:tetratricopeptide (TPR) repeat protein